MKRIVVVGAALLLVVLVWWAFRPHRPAPAQPALLSKPQAIPPIPPHSLKAPPPAPSAPAQTPVTALTTNRMREIVAKLLYTPPGRITLGEALDLVKELTADPNFAQIVRPLLASKEINDRLLGVYLMLEGCGLTDEMRAVALSDASPYVRAEVLNWLFRNQDFASVADLVRASAAKLSATDIQALVSLAASQPEAKVAVALHRLQLGRGLPRYVALLASESPAVVAGVAATLSDQQVSANGRIQMLGVLAGARPADYQTLLEKDLEAENILSVRCQLSRYLAAMTSEADAQARAAIEARFAELPEKFRPQIQYREHVSGQMSQLDKALRDICGAGVLDPMRLVSALALYLETGRLLGPGALSAETLKLATTRAAGLSLPLPNDTFAEAAFAQKQIAQ